MAYLLSAHKAFDKQSTFVAWGTEVESRRGRVGAPRFKLQQLASLLVRVCKLPVVTRKLLQGITGLLGASLHAQEIDDVLVARDLHLDRAYQRW